MMTRRRMGAAEFVRRISAAMSKKVNEVRTRIAIFFLLRNTAFLMDSLSSKIQSLLPPTGNRRRRRGSRKINGLADNDDDSEAENTERRGDLMHKLMEESESEMVKEKDQRDYGFGSGVAVMIPEDQGSRRSAEKDNSRRIWLSSSSTWSDKDVNEAAELFIQRFREQLCLQKQQSSKNQQQQQEDCLYD